MRTQPPTLATSTSMHEMTQHMKQYVSIDPIFERISRLDMKGHTCIEIKVAIAIFKAVVTCMYRGGQSMSSKLLCGALAVVRRPLMLKR